MQKTEQRAFAAVNEDGTIFVPSVCATQDFAEHLLASAVVNAAAHDLKRPGWRIRPVLIRVEDEGEGR